MLLFLFIGLLCKDKKKIDEDANPIF